MKSRFGFVELNNLILQLTSAETQVEGLNETSQIFILFSVVKTENRCWREIPHFDKSFALCSGSSRQSLSSRLKLTITKLVELYLGLSLIVNSNLINCS